MSRRDRIRAAVDARRRARGDGAALARRRDEARDLNAAMIRSVPPQWTAVPMLRATSRDGNSRVGKRPGLEQIERRQIDTDGIPAGPEPGSLFDRR